MNRRTFLAALAAAVAAPAALLSKAAPKVEPKHVADMIWNAKTGKYEFYKPKLHTGGIVRGGGLAITGEGTQPEAVIPFKLGKCHHKSESRPCLYRPDLDMSQDDKTLAACKSRFLL